MIFHDYSRTATILPPPIALKNSILVYVLVTNFDINNIKKLLATRIRYFLRF